MHTIVIIIVIASFILQLITFNYGKGSSNPIDEVWFYRKDQANEPKAVKVKREQVISMFVKQITDFSNFQVSGMLPRKFEECEIRLYLKKKVDQDLKQELLR